MSTATSNVVQRFLDLHPAEAAREMESATPDDAARLLGQARAPGAAAVLRYIQPDHAARVLAAAGEAEVEHFTSALDPA